MVLTNQNLDEVVNLEKGRDFVTIGEHQYEVTAENVQLAAAFCVQIGCPLGFVNQAAVLETALVVNAIHELSDRLDIVLQRAAERFPALVIASTEGVLSLSDQYADYNAYLHNAQADEV